MSNIVIEEISHRNGVWWYQAPKPRRLFHRHTPWTTAPCAEGYAVLRCACGATSYTDLDGWTEERKPRFRGMSR